MLVFILDLVLICLCLPLVAASTYYLVLAFVGISSRKRLYLQRKPRVIVASTTPSFAILVPAHNEEESIQKTLRSLLALDYPKDRYSIVVIADNCTDLTAKKAREMNVRCLERIDEKNRGKDWALDWSVKLLMTEPFDIFLVVDADCEIDSSALREIAEVHDQGCSVFQLDNSASNPDDGTISYLACIANRLENNYFFLPKHVLGLSQFLRGTGMAIHREILQGYPFPLNEESEDLAYSLLLIRNGIQIRLIPQASVRSDFPKTLAQLRIQRTRWLRGGDRLQKVSRFQMLKDGILGNNLMMLDASWTLFAQARVQMVILTFVLLLLSTFAFYSWGSWISFASLMTAICMFFLQSAFFLLGVWDVGVTGHRLRLLFLAPAIAFYWCFLGVRAKLSKKNGSHAWIRTPR